MDNLVLKGWSYQENSFQKELLSDLKKEFCNRAFKRAHIGNNNNKSLNSEIRTDNISWLQENETSPIIKKYQDAISLLMDELNQGLYLGLSSFEGHFASYEKGSFYKPHHDCFKNNNKRVVTFITYLNENWSESDGGQLRIYEKDKYTDILPVFGRTVCFLSDKILHEVLVANRERVSITGWFLRY